MQKTTQTKHGSYFTCQCCQDNMNRLSLQFEKYKGLDVVVCEKCYKHKVKFGSLPNKIQLDAGQLTTLSDKRTEFATNMGFALIPISLITIVVYLLFYYVNL